MICKEDGCENPVENRDLMLCASCNKRLRKKKPDKNKPKRIKQISDKKMLEIKEYSKRKKEFFKDPDNRICKVCGKPGADSIHHSKGKVGYADDEARYHNETLLLDTRYWIPIHSFGINQEFGMSCHTYIETHPEFARKIRVSSTRLGKEPEND